MRQFFFAIVLVAAAVVGGAIVNGPGFRWAQDHVFDYMGLKDGGEIALVDLPPAPGDANADPAPSQPPTGSSDRKGGPTAADRASRKPDPKPKSLPQVFGGEKPAPTPEPKSPEPVASAAPPTPTPSPTPDSIPIPPALAGPAGAPGPEPSAPPAPLDPGVAPAILASLSPAPAVALASAAAPAAPIPDAPASGGGDWAELRRKLKAQGVTRYTIEGETGGRVVFSCLIPLAGKQAVSQRFEAEGDDEFAAAQAALRRINLWRATRTAAPASS